MPDVRSKILIQPFRDHHWPGFWPIFSEIVAARESYAYDESLGQDEARRLWIEQPPGRTVVAVDGDGTVLGSAKMGPNRQGPGTHVATASFMVGSANRGGGVGRLLGEDALEWARAQGFRSMQFNAVVETNVDAVHLWKKLGFEIVGRVPEAFAHPKHGFVALLIMHRYL
jgi:L-amino acid N-acyltransferase YncA